MLTKILSAMLAAGLILAAGQSSALADNGGGNGGYSDSNPYVQVQRERQPDGSVIETTTTPGGTTVIVRNANGKIVSRKLHRRSN